MNDPLSQNVYKNHVPDFVMTRCYTFRTYLIYMKSRKKYETRHTVIELLIYDAINSDAKMGYVNLDTVSFQINQNSLEIFVPAQPL